MYTLNTENVDELFKKFENLIAYEDSPFTRTIQVGHDGAVYHIFSYRIGSYSDFVNHEVAIWSRGIMFRVTPKLELVCVPPPKFFNVNENPMTMGLENEPIDVVMEKADGSLISTYVDVNGELRLKSKASLHSEQAMAAMAWLDRPENAKAKAALLNGTRMGVTINMEWVSPNNQIVLAYGKDELIVLNWVLFGNERPQNWSFAEDDSRVLTRVMIEGLRSVEMFPLESMADLARVISSTKNAEGFVVRFKNGLFAKMKCEWYATRHKAKDDIFSDKKLLEMCLVEEVDDMIALFDDQFIRSRIEFFRAHASSVLNDLQNKVQTFYDANKDLSRKDYAIKGQEECSKYFSLVMSKYLGRPVEVKEYIMKHFDSFAPKYQAKEITSE